MEGQVGFALALVHDALWDPSRSVEARVLSGGAKGCAVTFRMWPESSRRTRQWARAAARSLAYRARNAGRRSAVESVECFVPGALQPWGAGQAGGDGAGRTAAAFAQIGGLPDDPASAAAASAAALEASETRATASTDVAVALVDQEPEDGDEGTMLDDADAAVAGQGDFEHGKRGDVADADVTGPDSDGDAGGLELDDLDCGEDGLEPEEDEDEQLELALALSLSLGDVPVTDVGDAAPVARAPSCGDVRVGDAAPAAGSHSEGCVLSSARPRSGGAHPAGFIDERDLARLGSTSRAAREAAAREASRRSEGRTFVHRGLAALIFADEDARRGEVLLGPSFPTGQAGAVALRGLFEHHGCPVTDVEDLEQTPGEGVETEVLFETTGDLERALALSASGGFGVPMCVTRAADSGLG